MSATTIAWIVLGVVVYFVVFLVLGILERKNCQKHYHDNCKHPYKTPVPLLWPAFVVFGIPVVILYGPFWIVNKLSNHLGAKL